MAHLRRAALFISAAIISGLVLSWVPVASADQADPRLTDLFVRLKAERDPAIAAVTEQSIWEIWLQSDDGEISALMERGIEYMVAQRLAEAVVFFTEVIRRAPGFAEAWNKRATAHYLNQDLAASVADIQRTLDLEPRHFGAISGLALILVQRKDPEAAIRVFKKVLDIHPHAQGAKMNIDLLRQHLRNNAV